MASVRPVLSRIFSMRDDKGICKRRGFTPHLRPDTNLFEPYVKGKDINTEIDRFNPTNVFLVTFVPAMTGSLSTIAIALLFHNDQISNYNWQCGRARLPSLSRITNLPFERTLWQTTVLFHIPLRCVELVTGFYRYGRLRSIKCPLPNLYTICRYLYFWLGLLELIFMAAIAIIGERENIKLHVVFFYIFGLIGMGFFLSNMFCHRYSLYYLKPYGHISFRLKILFTIMYFSAAPILFTSFILYWKQCITIAYDIFAVTEYCGVIINIAYHSLAFYDIRHKVVFSLRIKSQKRGNFEECLPMQPLQRTRG